MPKRKSIRSSEGANWSTYLISGKYYPRIKVNKGICECCEALKNKFHLLGCSLELCPCGCNEKAIDCIAEAYKEF